MARNKQMKELDDLIAEKRLKIEQFETEISALEELKRRFTGEPEKRRMRAPRSNVKALVLSLLEEAAGQGLNAVMAVEMATKRGEHLERGSVSSLLSRLKHDNAVHHDGAVYRLLKWAPLKDSDDTQSNVLSHPASRAAQ